MKYTSATFSKSVNGFRIYLTEVVNGGIAMNERFFIQESYQKYFNLKADKTRLNLDPAQFIEGLDVAMMYREMYWASEGYL